MTTVVGRAEKLWFLDTLVTVRVPYALGNDGVSVLEHHAREGDSPPLHIHQGEDEIFHVLEGELLLQVNGEQRRANAGESVLVPKGLPHSYRVESAGGARWLTITAGGDFENFIREMGRATEGEALPERSQAPTPEAIALLTERAREHRIDIVGPPLH